MPGGKDGHGGKALCPLHLTINFRKAVGLPPSYFGNAACLRVVRSGTRDDSVTDLAMKVRKKKGSYHP